VELCSSLDLGALGGLYFSFGGAPWRHNTTPVRQGVVNNAERWRMARPLGDLVFLAEWPTCQLTPKSRPAWRFTKTWIFDECAFLI
jgi:hypothetical protein